MKQRELPVQRDYLKQPRHQHERDPDYRDDITWFEETRTKQSDAEAADINYLLRHYEKTGQLPTLMQADPQYADFSDAGDYMESLNIIKRAQEQFNSLPARVRARFENDPTQMLEFVNDPANAREMIELGLATERKIEVTETPVSQAPPSTKTQQRPQGPKGAKVPSSEVEDT